MKVKLRLRADVIERDGKLALRFKNPLHYQDQLRQLKGKKEAFVTIESGGTNRSTQQNRYLWGVVYPILAEATGYSTEEIHEWCKAAYLPPKVLSVRGKALYVSQSTTSLTVGECVEYIDKLMRLANELGCIVPSLEEAGYISNKSAVVHRK